MTDSTVQSSELAGRRILVTRAAAQAVDLLAALTARGAEAVACPLLRIKPVNVTLPPLKRFHWLVVTSRNAVEHLPALPAALKVAAVGPGTAAALTDRGFSVQLQPERATGADLADSFRRSGLMTGTRVLRIRGDRAPSMVEDALRTLGAEVEVVTTYKTLIAPPPPAVIEELRQGRLDAVTFASGSAVEGLDRGLPPELLKASSPQSPKARVLAASLGPVTDEAAQASGWCRRVVAARPTANALVQILVDSLQ